MPLAIAPKYCCNNLVLLFGLAISAACAGCGGSQSAVAHVRGKVTLDGKPLAMGAVVTLPSGGRGAQGVIKNGEFELGTYSSNDGALIGNHRVAVIAQEQGESGPEGQPGKLLVPQRYTNPMTSELTIEVKPGEVNTPTLELKSQ
jgi:hypothetical protein